MREDDALLAAYVDGVSELTTDERRRVEELIARDPEARADEQATRALLGQLRELAPEGNEPDFAAMERAIRAEVGPTVPRGWWRSWRWIVPVSALAIAGAVFALWIHEPKPDPMPQPVAAHDAIDASAPIAPDETVPLWLDGAEVDVGLQAAELLGGDDTVGDDRGVDGLLPSADLAVVDELSPDAADRFEQWLARKKS